MHNVDIHSKDGSGDIISTHWISLDLRVCHIYCAQPERVRAFISDQASPRLIALLKYVTSIVWNKFSGMTYVLNWYATTVSEMTSRIFWVDKILLSRCLQRIHSPEQDHIVYRRSQVMVVLSGGHGTHSLATMRYNTFRNKVVSASSFATTERLLSTECVTKIHFRKAYYQVITVSNVITPFVSTIHNPFWLSAHRCDFSLGYDIICHPWPHLTFKNVLYKKEATKCLICPS